MATFKFTVKNYIPINGKFKQKVVYKFIDAPTESEARRKLDIWPKLIIKCEIYERVTPQPSN
jgi:hypothetical protein